MLILLNKKLTKVSLPLVLLLQFLFAEEVVAQEAAGSVIEKAMADELKRSMEELSLEGYEKPFFIAYSIVDAQAISINASLGAIIKSSQHPMRNNFVRVLVGDYDFNDESLNVYSDRDSYVESIGMPVDNDYFGSFAVQKIIVAFNKRETYHRIDNISFFLKKSG